MPLEQFRQKHIGGVKEKKKSFYKKTAKYCQAQERFLAMSSKRPDNVVIEVSGKGIQYKRQSTGIFSGCCDLMTGILSFFAITIISISTPRFVISIHWHINNNNTRIDSQGLQLATGYEY